MPDGFVSPPAAAGAALTNNAPAAETVGQIAVVGVGVAAARDDHQHALLGSSPQAVQLLSAAAAAGASGAPARFDHVHGLANVLFSLAADLTIAASVAFVNLTGFAFAIGANEIWQWEIEGWTTNTAARLALQLTGPAAPANVRSNVMAINTATGAADAETAAGFSTAMNLAAIGAAMAFRASGTVENGANAGTVQAQAAEVLAVNAVVVLRGTTFRAWRIA